MRWIDDVRFRLKALWTQRGLEQEMNEEMSFHLDMETRKYEGEGMSPDAARARAVREYGGAPRQRERAREAWGISAVAELLVDARHALRQLRRNPGFAAAALVTLALGIGANTAIFSIADQALLQRPPVRESGQLAAVYTTCRRGFAKCSSSYPDFIDYRDRSRVFQDLAGYSSVPLNVGDGERTRLATGHLVTGNFFELLGTRMHLGRAIQPADDVRDGSSPVVVLSFDSWEDAFGADSAVLGETVRLNGANFTVAGVAADGFRGLELNQQPDVWLPMFAGPLLGESAGAASGPDVFDVRGARWIGTLIGRLHPGATVANAQAEMDGLAVQLGEEYPTERAAVDGMRGITVDPAAGYILPVASAADLRRFVYLLLGVVGVTLLLASTNIANLLLARASARTREIGVRLAVGAGRGRLVRQLMTESLMLALVGGLAGLAVAQVMLRVLSAFALPGGVPISGLQTGLDARVLGFALGLSIVTALIFGLTPALQATRRSLVSAMKGEASDRGGGDHARMRKSLVGVQVALCLVLLMGAGLFVRTLYNSMQTDLGFRTQGVAVARFNLGLLQYDEERTKAFVDELLSRVRRLPGVESAGIATLVPFQPGGFRGTMASIPTYEPAADEEIRFDYLAVTSGFFRTLDTRIVEGRVFDASDVEGAPQAAVLNRLAAERYWARGSAIGNTMTFGGSIDLDVVGVIDDPVWRQVGEVATPFVFVSMDQFPSMGTGGFLTLVARTDGDAATILPAVRAQVNTLEPGLPLTFLRTMNDMLGTVLMPQRMGTTLLSLFGVVALLLAVVGIYGVVGYTVVRRSREIGIRIAVGASRSSIIREVMREMAPPVAMGLVVGGLVTLLAGRSVAAFMFQIQPDDPITFAGVGLVLLLSAGIATLLPARRAAEVDPVRILTSD